MAGPKEYVKDPDEINKNPDWLCPYCNTLNPDDNKFCSACGAARAESEANYFESKEKDREREEKREEARREAEGANISKAGAGRSRLPLFIALIIAAGLLIYLMMPKTKGLHVDAKSWLDCHSPPRLRFAYPSSKR